MDKKLKKNNIVYLLTSICVLTMFLPPIYLSLGITTLIIYFGEIPLILLFIYTLVSIIQINKIKINTILIMLLLIISTSIISLINATDYGRYIVGLSIYIELTMIILIFFNLYYSDKDITKFQNYYILSSIILCVQILYTTLGVNNGEFIIGNKIILDIGGSNYLASILMVPFFILLTLIFTNEKKIINIFSLIIIGTSIILTGSRTSLFILITLTTIILAKEIFFNFNIKFQKRIKYFLISILSLIIIYIFTGKFVKQMIQDGRFENLSSQANALSRFQIFRDYYNAFLEHPIIGNGLMNVNGLNENFLAHNFILQAFGDGGILFGTLSVTLLIYMYLNLSKIIKSKIINVSYTLGFKRGFTAVLIHGLFEPNFGTKLFMLYLFFGYCLAITEYYNVKINKEIKYDIK